MNEQLIRTPAVAAAATTGPARRRTRWVGAVTTAVAVAGVVWAVVKPPSIDATQLQTLPYVAAVAVIVGALLFGWLVPARLAAGDTGLPLAILAVPMVLAFWSGLPILFAGAAILLASAHRSARGGSPGRALAAIVLATLTTAAAVTAILIF
jgi:hypothetical protein